MAKWKKQFEESSSDGTAQYSTFSIAHIGGRIIDETTIVHIKYRQTSKEEKQ